VCPELRIGWRYVTRDMTRQMAYFGGKTFVPRLGELTMDQATSILIVPALGPAALAIFSRPKGLIRHVSTLVGKFSYILTPTAGSLHAAGDRTELGRMLTRCTMFGAYMALPMVLLLVILGGPILQVWMGEHYARHNEGGLILAIMAVGNLMTISQLPVLSILQGMDAHGRPGLSKLLASAASVGLAVLMLWRWDMGLLGAAVAVTLPMAIADGLYVPWHACRELGLSFATYLYEAWRGPVLAAIPFAAALVAGRFLMPSITLIWLAVSVAPAGVLLALTYWKFVLPASSKLQARTKLASLWGVKTQA
jgi:O-antigen/teichoic acid export membrane protein